MKYRFLANITFTFRLFYLLFSFFPLVVMAGGVTTDKLPAHLQQWASENAVIKVSPTLALPPYDFVDTAGHSSGYTADFYKALGALIPLRFDYGDAVNWAEQLVGLENGNIDIVGNCSKTPERETKFLFTKPMVTQVPGLLVNLSNKELLSLSNWSSKTRLGVVSGMSLLSYVEKFPQQPKILTASSSERGVIQVASGDLDAFFTYQSVASYWARSYNLSTVSFLPIANVAQENTYFCVRSGENELVEIINWGIKRLDHEKLATIQKKWFSSEMSMVENLLINYPKEKNNNLQFSLYMGTLVVAVLILVITIIFRFKKSEALNGFFGSPKLRSAFIMIVIFICIAFTLAIALAINSFKNSAYQRYQEQLDIAQDGATTILSEWVNEKKHINELILTKEGIALAKELINISTKQLSDNIPNNSDLEQLKKTILSSPSLEKIRDHISERVALNSSTGFFIISKGGLNLASMRDKNIGKQNLLIEKAPQYLSRAWLGETTLVPPVYSDVYFDPERETKDRPSTMFMLSPIVDANGGIIALLATRLDPRKGFSNTFRSANIGSTGEVYAVNQNGLMLSRNRYEGMMIENHELGESLSSILSIKMGNYPMKMILPELINTSIDINDRDYYNYRKTKVLGSWRWIDKLGFGIVAEVDIIEVLDSYTGIRNLLLITLFIALTTIITISTFMLIVGRRSYEISTQSKSQLEALVDQRTIELKRKQVQLVQSEEDNRLILESAPSAILVLDSKGVIQQVNQTTTELLGFLEGELLRRAFSSLFEEPNKSLVSNALTNYFQAPRSMGLLEEDVLTLRNSNGNTLYVEILMTPIDLSGGHMHMVAIRDMTRSYEANRTLKNAQKLANDANQAKSDFLANMSHEIRTPMNAIIGMSYLALQTEINNKAQNYIEKVNHAAESLLGIINDILDFSKIEAGKMELESIPFCINDSIDHIFNLLDIKIKEKNLELLFDFDVNIPPQLIGDPLRLNQIFLNLASNAVKFTHVGEITFTARVLKQEKKRIKLEFSVKDSGIGMSLQQKSRLFQSFSQADSSTTRKYGGTGLGLTICKRLAELMGGEIWVNSAEGKGSQVYFTCWCKFDPATIDNQQQYLRLDSLRALVIDDNAASLDVLSNIISSFGGHVTEAKSVEEAIHLIEYNDLNFDIAIVDLRMPRINGIEACQVLKARVGTPFKGFIIVSADDELLMGVNDQNTHFYLKKPVSSSSLFNAIMGVLGTDYKVSRRVEMREQGNIMQQKKLAGTHLLLVEDNELNQELAIELLQSANIVVSLAANGQQAVEMVRINQYDGILMDIQMPIMDGFTATAKIREFNSDIIIIAMTANAMTGDREKVINASMNDYISKPINVKKIFTTLATWITSTSGAEILLNAPSRINDDSTSLVDFSFSLINSDAGLATCNSNVKLYRKLLQKFIEEHANFEVEFRLALHWQDAIRIVHTLKGNAGNIGAEKLQGAVENLEHRFEHHENCIIERELKQVCLLLQATLSDIKDFFSVSTEGCNGVIQQKSSSIILDNIEALEQMLADFDTEALKIIKQLEEYSFASDIQIILAEIAKHINNYDFEFAQKGLTRLRLIFPLNDNKTLL